MFDKNFQFGVATSSYQIEGTENRGKSIRSIWDCFAEKQGAIADGSNGSRACDHFNRYKEDVSLMKELGIDVYRLSISWARIMPEENVISEEGLEFYKNLLIELKENGIKASATLYHWDMPEWIYKKNDGWPCRDTADLFLEYAQRVFDALDEYVLNWVTFNEPFCSSFLGYLVGIHAPGHKDIQEYLHAVHFINIAHGMAVRYYKSKFSKPIGIVLNLYPVQTVDKSIKNKIAVNMQDALINRMHLDPIFEGTYPIDLLMKLASPEVSMDFIRDEDMELISQSIDFLGVNYYTRSYVQYDSQNESLIKRVEPEEKTTTMGWEVFPDGLYEVIARVRKDYTDIPIIITENGSAWKDELIDGKVLDDERSDYLVKHLKVIEKLNEDNMNVTGYYVWSFMDNFEWQFGFQQRFGLVYIDYETQTRYPKQSFYRYKDIIRNRKL